jgi:hypothetical protein
MARSYPITYRTLGVLDEQWINDDNLARIDMYLKACHLNCNQTANRRLPGQRTLRVITRQRFDNDNPFCRRRYTGAHGINSLTFICGSFFD